MTAIRFSTLAAICDALDCQAGDILEYKKTYIKPGYKKSDAFSCIGFFYCVTKGSAAIVIASTSAAGVVVAAAISTASEDKDKDNYPSAAAAAK